MSAWPANALGGAQRVEQIGLRFAGEQIGEAREAILMGRRARCRPSESP
jgi:hypothetical protein